MCVALLCDVFSEFFSSVSFSHLKREFAFLLSENCRYGITRYSNMIRRAFIVVWPRALLRIYCLSKEIDTQQHNTTQNTCWRIMSEYFCFGNITKMFWHFLHSQYVSGWWLQFTEVSFVNFGSSKTRVSIAHHYTAIVAIRCDDGACWLVWLRFSIATIWVSFRAHGTAGRIGMKMCVLQGTGRAANLLLLQHLKRYYLTLLGSSVVGWIYAIRISIICDSRISRL